MNKICIDNILKNNVPVIFPDTCILLDILRFPRFTKGTEINQNSIKSAKRICESLRDEFKVVSVIAELVNYETPKNIKSVIHHEKENYLDYIKRTQYVKGWSREIGMKFISSTLDYQEAIQRCVSIQKEWICNSMIALATDELESRAMFRVTNHIPPAKLGKNSEGDCLILETCLELARELQEAKFPHPIVFASSNTKEFIDRATGDLFPNIKNEFEILNIEYASSLIDAAYELKLI